MYPSKSKKAPDAKSTSPYREVKFGNLGVYLIAYSFIGALFFTNNLIKNANIPIIKRITAKLN
jgi:hypothetical protein